MGNIKKINSRQLYCCIVAGAKGIIDNQALLNKINVYPVHDADTGNNLASTMLGIVFAPQPTESLKETAEMLADAAVATAKGTSGNIFAQFLEGLLRAVGNSLSIDVQGFADCLAAGVKNALGAVESPREGTMLSVMRDWGEALNVARKSSEDFASLLAKAQETALKSLDETAKFNKKAIVDAGAKGFTVFLENVIKYFNDGADTAGAFANSVLETPDFEAVDHSSFKSRYCMELLLSGKGLSKEKVLHVIENLGESIVMAGNDTKMRVHIHTDKSCDVVENIQTVGNLVSQKINDMKLQRDVEKKTHSKVGLLSDSTCDLPREILDRYQIQTVPLSIHFDEKYYLDHLTISTKQYLEKIEKSDELPTTAQPSLADFTKKYEMLLTHHDSVISLHLNGTLSGTLNISKKAADRISVDTNQKISVIDSGTATCGLGLNLLRIADAVEKGMSHDEIVSNSEKWIQDSNIWISIMNTKYLLKSGRFNSFKYKLVRFLRIKPIVSFKKDGRLGTVKACLTRRSNIKNMLENAKGYIGDRKVWNYALAYVDDKETALHYQKELKKLTGKDALFISEASPMLVGKVGPGATAIAIALE